MRVGPALATITCLALGGPHCGFLGRECASSDFSCDPAAAAGLAQPTLALLDAGPRRIFVTSIAYNGNLGGPGGADSRCASDANRPQGGTWKAMLADGVTRRACSTANCSGGISENIDWVLSPGRAYVRLDQTPIFTANDAGVFLFGTLTNSFGTTPQSATTGLDVDWTPRDTCGGWTGAGTHGFGTLSHTGSTAIRDGSDGVCTNAFYRLICVEQ